jgi:hypothetical protein
MLLLAGCAWMGLCTGSTARAEFVTWDVTASNATVFNTNNPSQTSSIVFNGSTVQGSSLVGSLTPTNANVYSITINSSVPPNSPDSFTNAPFSLPIQLTDEKSKGLGGAISSGSLTLSGILSADHVSKVNFHPQGISAGSEQIVLGSPGDWRLYTVALAGDLPGPGNNPSTLHLQITVVPTTDPPSPPDPGGSGVSPTPEPASLVLAGLALPLLLLSKFRRKSS